MHKIRKKSMFASLKHFILICLSMPISALAEPTEVALITEVLPEGQKAVAVALQYNAEIDGTTLSPSTFMVEATINNSTNNRTITKVYTNDAPAMTASGNNGEYVILELDLKDENAGMTYYTWVTQRHNVEYFVTQKADIVALNGNTFSASAKAYQHDREIDNVVDDFIPLVYQAQDGFSLPYRLFEPATEAGKLYPLVLFLHGAGERHNDNLSQMIANQGAIAWAQPVHQAHNPAYVAAPQCPSTLPDGSRANWIMPPVYQSLLALLRHLQDTYQIDPARIYVTGLSMGGIGSWHLIQNNPDLFAAAVPVCGLGYPDNIEAIKDLPIWAFHAEDDDVVPVTGRIKGFPVAGLAGTRDVVEALKTAGSAVKYTEYPKGTVIPPHFSWRPTYLNEEMIDWLFVQKKP